MNLNEMINQLGQFSTSLNEATPDRQSAFFRAFFQAYASLQNPQTQAQAVTVLHAQVQNILGNQQNQELQAVETTEALLHLANLASSNTINHLTFGDQGALNVAHTNILRKRNLSELFQIYFQNPQEQAIQNFNSIIIDLLNNQPSIQQGLITVGQVVNQASQAAAEVEEKVTPPQPSSPAAAAAPITPRESKTPPQPLSPAAAAAPITPPGAPVQDKPVELQHLPQAMQDALLQLQPQVLPMPEFAPNGASAAPAGGRPGSSNDR